MGATEHFHFDNSYARELEGFYTAWQPATVRAPELVFFNHALAAELGLDAAALDSSEGAAIFAGNRVPNGAAPLAQVYAGHQFGGFSPQLGDGRALLLGEVIDRQGRRRDIAFKGSGRTPYSRGGDGKAALGPMLREVLMGEAMHALGVPTTRALAVAATGEAVQRELTLPGAVLTRVADSHIRVGTFEFFAARGDVERLRRLADYSVARHDPDLQGTQLPYLALLDAVVRRQAKLIAQWMNLGFIHGVMNTDNMTLSGQTIDYGPCAFMEAFDPKAVFSSIDHGGRYAYGQQPYIAQWNLARLAQSLLPILDDDAEAAVAKATTVINSFPQLYQDHLLQGQRAKLGLTAGNENDALDRALVTDWLQMLHTDKVDFTLAWRHLGSAAAGDEAPLRALFLNPEVLSSWLQRWHSRCGMDSSTNGAARAQQMHAVNPWVTPRNHHVEEALNAASNDGNLQPFKQLLAALQRPFDDRADLAGYAQPAPAAVTAAYQTFCGT